VAEWRQWRGGTPLGELPTLAILLKQRLPRTLTALLAGGGLALVGCCFQALLRNPLATPYTLGIASAGALGAWLAMALMEAGRVTAQFLWFSPVQAAAFLFAMADVALLYLLARRHRRLSSSVLLLAGVTLGMIANAGILFMGYFARPDRLVIMNRWLMGGLDVIDYEPFLTLLVGVTPCLVYLLAQSGKFDQFGFSPELAEGRGVNVARLQAATFIAGSFAVAVIVSRVGPIGFVGLIVPHAVRAIVGSRHRVLMPLCVVVGGGFLCLCDIAARRILPHQELPVGIVTALLGGPFFLYLLLRKGFKDWDA